MKVLGEVVHTVRFRVLKARLFVYHAIEEKEIAMAFNSCLRNTRMTLRIALKINETITVL